MSRGYTILLVKNSSSDVRLDKLIRLLDRQATLLLANEHDVPEALHELLLLHMNRTITRQDSIRLRHMLRSVECDRDMRTSLRLTIGLLLICLEMNAADTKSPPETQLERG